MILVAYPSIRKKKIMNGKTKEIKKHRAMTARLNSSFFDFI